MDTNLHNPARIVHTWLATRAEPPCPLYYDLMPEGQGVDVAALGALDSAGTTQRSARGPQYTQYGVQIWGRGNSTAEARLRLWWAIEHLATVTPKTPKSVTIEGQVYLLSSAARFGTIGNLGQTEKHRYTMATQDYRITILKG